MPPGQEPREPSGSDVALIPRNGEAATDRRSLYSSRLLITLAVADPWRTRTPTIWRPLPNVNAYPRQCRSVGWTQGGHLRLSGLVVFSITMYLKTGYVQSVHPTSAAGPLLRSLPGQPPRVARHRARAHPPRGAGRRQRARLPDPRANRCRPRRLSQRHRPSSHWR